MKYVDFEFFKEYKSVCDIPTIKPSIGTGRPYVIDIRQIRYERNGDIYFNLSYDDESWERFPHKIVLRYENAKKLYTSELSCFLPYLFV